MSLSRKPFRHEVPILERLHPLHWEWPPCQIVSLLCEFFLPFFPPKFNHFYRTGRTLIKQKGMSRQVHSFSVLASPLRRTTRPNILKILLLISTSFRHRWNAF